jgi:hypothetical protein
VRYRVLRHFQAVVTASILISTVSPVAFAAPSTPTIMSIGSSVGGSPFSCMPDSVYICPWSRLGEPVTFGASFYGPPGNGGFPTGEVKFFDNGQPVGSAMLVNGGASLTLNNLAEGSHFVTVEWAGDATFLPPVTMNGVPHMVRATSPGWLTRGSPLQINTSPLPAIAEQVLVNLTVTNGLGSGYLTANRCGDIAGSTTSNANFAKGTTSANLAVVAVDISVTCLLASEAVQAIVDIQGFFAHNSGLFFQARPPARALDTRSGAKPTANTIIRVNAGVEPGSQVVLANLTTTDAHTTGYITADKCSVLTTGLQTRSNGNYADGTTTANLAVVPLDPDGSFCIYTSESANVIVDVQGTFTAQSADRFTRSGRPGSPAALRALDTRGRTRPDANSITTVRLSPPTGSASVLVNLTTTDAEGTGYITADRCSALSSGAQSKSNGNFTANSTTPNLAVVPLDADGTFCIYTSASAHLIADIQGTLSADGANLFTPVPARRVYDSRIAL